MQFKKLKERIATAKIDLQYHKKQMEYQDEQIKILERFLKEAEKEEKE